MHEGIGIRRIALSPNGQLDSVDDLPPYLDAALSEALTQFQDEVVTELGRAWPELPDTGSLALRGTRIDGDVLRAWYGEERDPVVTLRPGPLPRATSRQNSCWPAGSARWRGSYDDGYSR